jgi:hypothetical protein
MFKSVSWKSCLTGLGAMLLCSGLSPASFAFTDHNPKAAATPASLDQSFEPNVKVTVTEDALIIVSDGIPTHATGTFPNKTNPNRILKQSYRFTIPRHPKRSEKPTPTPFGPIGVAINGIPFYNPYNAEGRDAVFGPNAEIFDFCCGHPDPMGRYHYHKYPVCLKTPFKDTEGEHSPRLGTMFDSYALYGPNGADGKPPTDLDECNGHEDQDRGYHYHVTAKFPYLIGSYRGVVDSRNIDRPRFPGRNGPFGMRGGPGGGPPPSPLMTALDKDGDGTLSADEIKAASQALQALDQDGDGSLSRTELRPRRPEGPPGGGPGFDGQPPPGPPR